MPNLCALWKRGSPSGEAMSRVVPLKVAEVDVPAERALSQILFTVL